MKLFLLFCLISVSVFSQTEKQTIFIQGLYGNTFYNNPTLKTNSFCPTAEILLTCNATKKDSLKINFYSFAGFGYTHTTQNLNNQFITIDNSTQFVAFQKVNINEFTINIGGGLHYNTSKIIFLNFGVAAQMSANYLGFEFYQFYILGKLQVGARISKRVSFLSGFSSRFFLAANDVSVQTPTKFFNYAPIKLTVNAGIQVKLFK